MTGKKKKLQKGELTDRQSQVFSKIARLLRKSEISPSYADIAVACGLAAPTIQYYIRTLTSKGYLAKVAGKTKSLYVV